MWHYGTQNCTENNSRLPTNRSRLSTIDYRLLKVKAKDDGKYWKLDRESFSNIVQDAAMKKRDKSARVGNVRML